MITLNVFANISKFEEKFLFHNTCNAIEEHLVLLVPINEVIITPSAHHLFHSYPGTISIKNVYRSCQHTWKIKFSVLGATYFG